MLISPLKVWEEKFPSLFSYQDGLERSRFHACPRDRLTFCKVKTGMAMAGPAIVAPGHSGSYGPAFSLQSKLTQHTLKWSIRLSWWMLICILTSEWKWPTNFRSYMRATRLITQLHMFSSESLYLSNFLHY